MKRANPRTDSASHSSERLWTRSAHLQGKLTKYWSTIGHAAVQIFRERLPEICAASATTDVSRAIYDLWFDSAELAHARVVRRAAFCRLQADLINTFNALHLVAQGERRETLRRHSRFADYHPLRGAPGSSDGCSGKRAVWSKDKVTLYRYNRIAAPAPVRPLLICFALVNRPYVLDLQPDRSLIRRLLERGLDVYLIDWGYPQSDDRRLGLEDYIEDYLDGCVRSILRSRKITSLNLLGICQGGALSLCYTALHPKHVRTLTTVSTPVDFHTPRDLLSKWARGLDADLMTRAGNIPGEALNALYLSLMPFRLTQQKYLQLLTYADDQQRMEHFMRMEQWIFDCPDQAAAAFGQYLKWFYQDNRLFRGALELAGRRVDLRNIVQPVLNIYAARDHIVPPAASKPLQRFIGTSDYTAYSCDTGHIGVYVSRRAQQQVPMRIINWLSARNS